MYTLEVMKCAIFSPENGADFSRTRFWSDTLFCHNKMAQG
jgi:hypothetical protein